MFVFISHGDADRDFAAEIANYLRNAGIEAWLDASDVEPGTNWLRSGARALDRADAMILVISAKTSGSPDLKKAFEFAMTTPRFENRVITVERRAPAQTPFRYPWILRELPFIKEAQDTRRTAEKILNFLKTAA
ncbi:MAG TPA: toll/interleukin-1 receptor domain-containing protein [Thermoanaerobaculia bacterium]